MSDDALERFMGGNIEIGRGEPREVTWSYYAPSSKQPRTVFVAYPYSFSKNDYRAVFSAVGEEFDVTFNFADEKITNVHVLEKIRAMIKESTFSIFDITTWNPNVTLELGIAVASGEDYYILFSPEREGAEVPSDLGGIDRLQYADYSTLKDELRRLMTQQFGSSDEEADRSDTGREFSAGIALMEQRVPEIVASNPGIQIGGIASELGIPIEHAQPIVRSQVDSSIVTRGQRRGTRYYLPDAAPVERDDE